MPARERAARHIRHERHADDGQRDQADYEIAPPCHAQMVARKHARVAV